MIFLKRLFSHREKPASEPRGAAMQQTQVEQDATRTHMESELAGDRERRGATDVRPGSEQPPAEDA